jgi:hypothetical protein
MGTLPGLFTVDRESGEVRSIDAADMLDDEIIKQILELERIVQPRALWTRDLNSDGKNELTEDILWQYHPSERIWAGWRGPYLPPPASGVVEDAWGNPLVFIIGDLVSYDPDGSDEMETYRCVQTHDSGLYTRDLNADPPQPGPHDPRADGGHTWRKLPLAVSAKSWWLNKGEKEWWDGAGGRGIKMLERSLVRETYYDDAFVIISFGRDGSPGGNGLDEDLVLTIYREEYTGEVSGHAGYGVQGNYTTHVALRYPAFNALSGDVVTEEMSIKDNDGGYGVNFCFGSGRLNQVTSWECDCWDEFADCQCIARHEDSCLAWVHEYGWENGSSQDPLAKEGGWYAFYGCEPTSDQGVECPMFPNKTCYPVSCATKPASALNAFGEDFKCLEYDPEGPCTKWSCERPVSDDEDCNCDPVYEITDGASAVNYAQVAVPIGVRTLTAADGDPLIFTVSPGPNWIGTVR